jgi:hypothetical protein
MAARKTRKPRKAKTDTSVLTAEEQVLQDKYPDRKIVAGSLLKAGEDPHHPKSRSVEIRCERCDKPRRIGTSDLFQVRFCGPECKKAAKKEIGEEAKK